MNTCKDCFYFADVQNVAVCLHNGNLIKDILIGNRCRKFKTLEEASQELDILDEENNLYNEAEEYFRLIRGLD